MSAAEKTLAERMAEAWDGVLGKDHWASDLSNNDLLELSKLLYAVQLDLQNEWVRREMMAE